MDESKLEVTEIDISPIKPRKGLVGFATITIAEKINGESIPTFYFSGIGIYKFLKKEGFYIRYPKKELSNNKTLDVYHPINKFMGDYIQKKIVEEATPILKKASE